MSVNAARTVSIAPVCASLRSCSSESIPWVPPGPPGRAPSVAGVVMPILGLTVLIALLPGISGRGRGGRCHRRGFDHVAKLVGIDRADGAVIAVLGSEPPPDPDDQPDEQHQRRVVKGRPGEARVPRGTGHAG